MGPTQITPGQRAARGGVVLASGVQTVVAGPFRVDPYTHKSCVLLNQGNSNASITGFVQLNLDENGNEARLGSQGQLSAVAPCAALWVSSGSMVSVPPGAAALVVLTIPASWVQIVATSSLANQTASGYVLASAT